MTISVSMEQPGLGITVAGAHRCSRAPKLDHCDMVFGVACPDAMNASYRKTIVTNAQNMLKAYLPTSKSIWTDLPLGNHKPPGGQHTPLAVIADCAENLLALNGATSLRPDLSSIHQESLYCFVLDGTGELVEVCYFGMLLEHKNPANGTWEPLTVSEPVRFNINIPVTLTQQNQRFSQFLGSDTECSIQQACVGICTLLPRFPLYCCLGGIFLCIRVASYPIGAPKSHGALLNAAFLIGSQAQSTRALQPTLLG
jgi:hypothetical protein